jgi:hypothetical protein
MSHQNAGDNDLVCMFNQTRTTGLENLQDSILSAIATALVPITAAAWKAAQHFSYGARGFMRVPVSEANDLNFLLYDAQSRIETLLLWPTETWLLPHGREMK